MEVGHTFEKLKMNWVHSRTEYYYMSILLVVSE